MSGGANTTCGQPLVECYDAGSTNGVYAVRVWTAPTGAQSDPGAWTAASCGATPIQACAQTTFLPYVTNVELDVNPLCFGYFTYTDCTANVAATVVRGTGANSFSVGTFDVMQASSPSGTTNLTDPDNDGVFTGTMPIDTAGPNPVTLTYHWQLRQNGPTWRTLVCANGNGNTCQAPASGTTSWGTVHRAFRASNGRTGPLKDIQVRAVTSPPTGLVESVPAGFTDQVTVTLRVTGTLSPQSQPNDPLVALRAFDGSQTQSIDCMPGVNFRDELAGGCNAFYKINDGTNPVFNPCPQPSSVGSPEPWECLPTQTGGSIGQFGQGLGMRLGNTSSCVNVNHWPEIADPDSPTNPLVNKNDPRTVQLILVPYGAFAGSGNQNYPITNVGLFYITGFGASGGNDDVCPDKPGGLEDPASSGDIVGHFFKRIGINDDESVPSDEPCVANSITPCVAVLVD